MATSFEIADAVRAGIADLLDLQLAPLGLAAINALSPVTGQTILDVGCGAGDTVRQLASRVGVTGHIIGIDIGLQSLAVARSRTTNLPNVTLLFEDAAVLNLPDESVDGVYSRFGVMFFDDPIGAFSNLRRMIRQGGRISFVCWRSWQENELDYLPVHAAGLDLAIDQTPFSFEQSSYVTDVLRSAGFGRIQVRGFDTSVICGDVEDTLKVLMSVGALGNIVRVTPALKAEAEQRVRTTLLGRQDGPLVELGAATWIVTAVAE